MSVTKRLWDLARANLGDFRTAFSNDPLDELDEDERRAVEEELERERKQSAGAKAGRTARKVKDAAEDAWERAYEKARARGGGGEVSSEAERRRWYRTLELEPGADMDAVRKAYRRLLRQYHPDKFAREPDKLKVATEVTRKVTEAYNGLSRHLGAR